MSGSQADGGCAQEPTLPGKETTNGQGDMSGGRVPGLEQTMSVAKGPASLGRGFSLPQSRAPATVLGLHTPQPTFGPACPLSPTGAAKKALGRAVAPLGRG